VNDLIATLTKAGAPILGTLIGGPVGTIAGAAIGALAEALGTPATPEAVKQAIETRPEAAAIVRAVEAEKAPDLLELQKAWVEVYAETSRTDAAKGWFYNAWKPAGMWLVLLMWPFAVVLAPFFRITVPMADLVAFTGLYLTLYMGGHTAKEWFNAHYSGRRP
jgi:hypothetical protein